MAEKGTQPDERPATKKLRSSDPAGGAAVVAADHEAKMKKKTVMLGSSSKWRAALIKDVLAEGFTLFPERLSPDIDEKAIRRDDPKEMVVAIANAKADALIKLLSKRPNSEAKPDLLLCADQVIVFDGVAREKPESQEQCKMHLQSYGLQNKPAECTSGLVVVDLATGIRCDGVDVAIQHFKEVPDSVAEALIAKGDIMYCAGSFVAEDPLLAPYLGPTQGEIESVQGMPVALTNHLLKKASSLALESRNL